MVYACEWPKLQAKIKECLENSILENKENKVSGKGTVEWHS